MDGVLVINKPQEMTSHDVVAILRRKLNTKKIGHTGTLDPMATGVLPICIGRATKIVDYLVDKTKAYECTFELGTGTDTQDQWGTVTETIPVPELTDEAIFKVIQGFIGEIEQIPPMYSALKVNGQKLVDLARKGIEIERKPRKITIYNIENILVRHKTITMTVYCSKGTYIRTLCYDIGKALGTTAHMTKLERVLSEPFTLDKAVSLEEVSLDTIQNYLISMDDALAKFQRIDIFPNAILKDKILNGVKMDFQPLSKDQNLNFDEKFYRIYVDNLFLGIGEKTDGRIIMKKRLII